MIKLATIILLIFIGILCGFRYIVVPTVIKNHNTLIDFNKIPFPSSPNFYYSPATNYVFHISITKLQQRWDLMIAKQPRVTELISKQGGKRRVYVQLSAFWHFPDFIDVEFIALGPKRSSIAIYSRSRFGYSDFDVNKQRVKRWLSLLRLEASSDQSNDTKSDTAVGNNSEIVG